MALGSTVLILLLSAVFTSVAGKINYHDLSNVVLDVAPYLSHLPQSRNDFLGSHVTFYCTGVSFDLLTWRVRGTILQTSGGGVEFDFSENTTSSMKYADLIVPVQWQFHLEPLICTGLYINGNKTFLKQSDIVMVQVQGQYWFLCRITFFVCYRTP